MARQITHTPNPSQAFWWLLLLLLIPFSFWFKNRIAAYFYNQSQCHEPRRREWRHYGITIPPGYSVHGIDVSHYSCTIDWAGVKAMNHNGVTVDFAFMRATRGLALIDYTFKQNWEGAKKAGILRGAYHFYYYSQDAAEQAHFFLNQVNFEKGDLPPVLDIEDDKQTNDTAFPKEKILQDIETWLRIVERKTGVVPLIYTNLDYYKRYIAGERFQKYPIWIAGFKVKNIKLTDGREWWFWQTSEKARCNGISEKVDFNVFAGSEWQLKAICIP